MLQPLALFQGQFNGIRMGLKSLQMFWVKEIPKQ